MSDAAEARARARAHSDGETVASARAWILDHFGGCGTRAAWFFDELDAIFHLPIDKLHSDTRP